ncbi:solute carrier family 46 member 3 [Alligator mississippiensis]|uniref:Solute carrier family 46 member 3 n=1 Tax=Alligator mississippiensis TaxID=8496 RepID=A0A151MSA8_ALLMI|nr:solute carrier family 46 member 3 [Alligator mississippiensis]
MRLGLAWQERPEGRPRPAPGGHPPPPSGGRAQTPALGRGDARARSETAGVTQSRGHGELNWNPDMRKVLLVEPVIVIYCFAFFLSLPLVQQYIYRRLWEEENNTTFIDYGNTTYCEQNQSNPAYIKQKEVQQKASLFSLQMDLSGSVPSIIVAFIVVANGDRYGRKRALVLPSLGALMTNVFYSILSYFSWTLSLFFALAFISGLFGSLTTFLGVYIGYGAAAFTSVSLTSFLGVYLFSQFMKDIYIVFIGIFSYIGGIIMAAFAKTTLLMFLVRVPSLLCFMPVPVLRSMLSKVVLDSEQGAVFACIACLEAVTGSMAYVVFNSLYAATVIWFPGFSFLIAAGICIIPLSILSGLLCTSWHEEDLALLTVCTYREGEESVPLNSALTE